VHCPSVVIRHVELAAIVPGGHTHWLDAASHDCAAGQSPQSAVSAPQESGAKPQAAWALAQVRGAHTARGGWEGASGGMRGAKVVQGVSERAKHEMSSMR
jgi:hypothetical protein